MNLIHKIHPEGYIIYISEFCTQRECLQFRLLRHCKSEKCVRMPRMEISLVKCNNCRRAHTASACVLLMSCTVCDKNFVQGIKFGFHLFTIQILFRYFDWLVDSLLTSKVRIRVLLLPMCVS